MITKITFTKAYNLLRACDQDAFREAALNALHITTQSSFYSLMRGDRMLTAVQYLNLLALFKEYGVAEPFEFVTE